MSSYRKTVSLDLDGVLHGYSRGWQGGELYDPPTPGCAEALARLAEKYRLVVCTARDENLVAVWQWLNKYGLDKYIDDVSNTKPKAVVYLDDRGVTFTGDWTDAEAAIDAMIAHHDGLKSERGPNA